MDNTSTFTAYTKYELLTNPDKPLNWFQTFDINLVYKSYCYIDQNEYNYSPELLEVIPKEAFNPRHNKQKVNNILSNISFTDFLSIHYSYD